MIKTVRHETNPFLSKMNLMVGLKQVKISKLGKDNNILINQITNENHGGTHVISYKKVETKKFIKTFADYMAFTFDLTRAGNKALRVLMWAVQEDALNKDQVNLDRYTLENFLKTNNSHELDLSYPTFMRGIAEIEKAQIIAKTLRAGVYFINPEIMFNGDRIAFTTVIERDKALDEINAERQKLEAAGQQKLEI